MTTRKILITELTQEQKDAIPAFADERIALGWKTGPLSPEEWQQWESAAQACYGYAGVPWPANTVRVASPFVAALAAPVADMLIRQLRVGDAVRVAVRVAVRDAVHGAVGDAVRGAVGDAVRVAVRVAVDGAMGDAVHVAVGDAVRDAVGDAVRVAVDDAVGDAVDGAVRGAVGLSKEAATAVAANYYRYLGGQHWPYWTSYAAFFRDICHLPLDPDIWNRSSAYETTQTAGNWHPYRDFTMVVDRPVMLHLEQIGPRGWGSHRLHNPTGPAIAWSNGDAIHAWHGTVVPADLIEGDGWTVERIMAEKNTEIRRCAIERLGWDTYLNALNVQPRDTCADPGNPGHHLALYDLPSEAQLYPEPIRLLVMRNASLDRDGTRRTFAETVPMSCETAIEAAAWQFSVPVDTYAALMRAT